ncbi:MULTISPECIES: aldose 1-epimerase [unclassified Streptomyces]|uniref:aldose epimerase family protein n=1 Tax=unclassified Streptomyces TaxID=2593676 RepID=UPI003808D70F
MATDQTHDGRTDENAVQLEAGQARLTIHPDRGCRVASLTVDGVELLRQGEKFGSFPMVPWCGRTRDGQFRNGGVLHQLPRDAGPHAIHGTGRHTAWAQAPGGTATEASFYFDLAEPWPYKGRVTQRFVLAEDHAELTMSVETTGDSFPAQAGWHPWFLRNLGSGGQDAEIAFSPGWMEERGEDHLPTGRRVDPKPRPWDDCFGMPDGVDVTLTWPGELLLRVTSPAPWVVLYDEQPEAVCVEPQSGPPNGLNTDPRLVTPIEPLEMRATWAWERLG